MHKKVTLLQHFKNYLELENPENECKYDLSKLPFKIENNLPPVYVKKWMRTRHAILFRLSNKIVQVCFEDNTEIVLDSDRREVTYLSKKKELLIYELANALESSNNEMTKRLKYTKDVLTHMLSANQGKSISNLK